MHLALEAIWLMLGEANRYFSAQEPWVLRKSEAEADQQRFRTVLYTTMEVVRVAALLVQPVMPESAAKLLDLLGQPADQRDLRRDRHPAGAGHRAARPGRGLPALSGGVTRVTSCHVSRLGGVLRASPREHGDIMTGKRTHVVVIGGGYAGTLAANHLRMRGDIDITLVNPRPKFVERIRLHQLVAGNHDATADYGTLLGEGIQLVVDSASRIDTAAQTVQFASGRRPCTTTTSSTRSAAPARSRRPFQAPPNSPIP